MSTWMLILFSLIGAFGAYIFWRNYVRLWNKKLPKGRLGLPMIGENMDMIGKGYLQFGDERFAKYKSDAFLTNVLFRDTVWFTGPKYLKWLFAGDNKYLQAHLPKPWQVLFGKHSLLLLHGESHRKARKILNQAFETKALMGYTPIIYKVFRKRFEKWVGLKDVDVFMEVKHLAFEITAILLLGESFGEKTDELVKLFLIWMDGFGGFIPYDLPFLSFGKGMRARERILEHIENAVTKPKEGFETEYRSMLEIILNAEGEDGKKLSMDQVKDQILLQLFAGHDTTSSAMCSLIYLLQKYPEVLDKIREEIKQVFPDPDEPWTFDKLKEMKYVDATIKEILRTIPTAGFVGRTIITDSASVGDYELPKGMSIMLSTCSILHDPQYYPEPEKFEPERFLEPRTEDKPKTGPTTYYPFGGGTRLCLGMELAKLELRMMAMMLANDYSWKVTDKVVKMHMFPFPRPEPNISFKRNT